MKEKKKKRIKRVISFYKTHQRTVHILLSILILLGMIIAGVYVGEKNRLQQSLEGENEKIFSEKNQTKNASLESSLFSSIPSETTNSTETTLSSNSSTTISYSTSSSSSGGGGGSSSSSSSTDSSGEQTETSVEITPVYVTINSHAENSITFSSKDRYQAYRDDLLARAQLIYSYGAKLNWESDYSVLLAMQEYETSDLYTTTDNKNILQYMKDDLGDSIDPHLHPTSYNYADIAYLIQQLGVTPSDVIGGLVVFECVNGQPEATDWHTTLGLASDGYVYGSIYPSYKWKPEILSGAGSASHVYDELTSGMWYPGTGDQFYTDQGSGIVLFGQGYDHDATLISPSNGQTLYYSDGGYIKELVSKIQSGELPAGKFYSANLHLQDTSQIGSTGVATNDALQEVLDQLKPYADAGYIKYVTYDEAVDIWKTQYNSEPNQVPISIFSQYDNIKTQEQGYCSEEQTCTTDSDCSGTDVCVNSTCTLSQCSDGVDNDENGFIDYGGACYTDSNGDALFESEENLTACTYVNSDGSMKTYEFCNTCSTMVQRDIDCSSPKDNTEEKTILTENSSSSKELAMLSTTSSSGKLSLLNLSWIRDKFKPFF